MTEIWKMSATELATRIRSSDLSSREVIEAHLRRVETVNPAAAADCALRTGGPDYRAALSRRPVPGSRRSH
jgi:amidase